MVVLSRRRLLCCALAGVASFAVPDAAVSSPLSESTRELHLTCEETGESFDEVYWVGDSISPTRSPG